MLLVAFVVAVVAGDDERDEEEEEETIPDEVGAAGIDIDGSPDAGVEVDVDVVRVAEGGGDVMDDFVSCWVYLFALFAELFVVLILVLLLVL